MEIIEYTFSHPVNKTFEVQVKSTTWWRASAQWCVFVNVTAIKKKARRILSCYNLLVDALTLRRVEVGRGRRRMVFMATILAMCPVLAARWWLERTCGEADHGSGSGGRVKSSCRSGGVHVLVCAHLLPETCTTIAEPHLYSSFGQLGPGTN